MTETGIKADTGVWKSMSEAGLEEIDSLNLCNSFRILGNESFSAFRHCWRRTEALRSASPRHPQSVP